MNGGFMERLMVLACVFSCALNAMEGQPAVQEEGPGTPIRVEVPLTEVQARQVPAIAGRAARATAQRLNAQEALVRMQGAQAVPETIEALEDAQTTRNRLTAAGSQKAARSVACSAGQAVSGIRRSMQGNERPAGKRLRFPSENDQ